MRDLTYDVHWNQLPSIHPSMDVVLSTVLSRLYLPSRCMSRRWQLGAAVRGGTCFLCRHRAGCSPLTCCLISRRLEGSRSLSGNEWQLTLPLTQPIPLSPHPPHQHAQTQRAQSPPNDDFDDSVGSRCPAQALPCKTLRTPISHRPCPQSAQCLCFRVRLC